MFGSVPKRISVADLEILLMSLGYRVSREPFQVVAFKAVGRKHRLHLKVETFGGKTVPRDAPIDLHIDILSEPMKYHKSLAFDGKIVEEMEVVNEGILTAETRVRGGDSIATCPVCRKELAGRFLGSHIKVNHSGQRSRRG